MRGTLTRVILALGGAILITIVLLVVVWTKLSSDEYAACRIQQRGLPASRELAQVMSYSFRLFTDPRSHAQARSQPPPTGQQLADLVQLRTHLGRYAALESKQPRSRSC